MKRIAKMAVCSLAALSTLAAVAQTQPEPDRSSLASLLFLKGQRVNVGYSPGSLDRAVRVQTLFEKLTADFASWSRARGSMGIYLLSPEEWERAQLGLPFGMPVRLPMNVIAVPAWGDDAAVELWRGLVGPGPPSIEPSPLRGSAAEAGSLVITDLLAQAEAARMLLEGAGIAGDKLWVSELLAQSLARSARVGGSATAGDSLYTRVWSSRQGGNLPLSAYRAGVSMEDWLWFQAVFHRGAAVIAQKAGADAAKQLLKQTRKRGGTLPAAVLLERFPQVAGWYEESFAATAPR